MATDLERLVVSLSADIKSYEKAMAKAQGVTTTALRKIEADTTKSMGRFEKTMNKAGASLAGFGKGLVLGGVATAIAGLTSIVSSSVSTAASIGDLSDKLGITSTKLQELQYGAVQANLGFEEMEKGLLKFSKSLAEAQSGQGDFLKLLEANGFEKAQIKALDYSQALDVVADLIKNAATEQDALLIATQAFGRNAGSEYVEFLRKGSEGLKQFAKDAHGADAIIKEGLVKSAQAFDDAWSAAMLSVKAKLGDFVLSAIPLIQKLDEAFNNAAKNFGVAIGTLDPALIDSTSPVSGPKSRGSPSTKSDRQPTTVIYDPEADAAKTKAIEASTKAYAAQQKAITGVIEALKFENEQLTRSELSQEINNQLRRAGVSATSAQGKEITALVTKNFELAQSIEAAETAGENFLEQQEELKKIWEDFGQSSIDAFESIISGGEDAADVLKKLAIEFIKAAIQAKALASVAGSTGSGGGFLSSIFGSLFGGGGAPKLYAKGGKIPAGQYGIAGEGGQPELIQGPANVIPFDKLRGNGKSNITIINNAGVNVTAKQDSKGNASISIERMLDDRIDGRLKGRFGIQPQQVRR